MKLQDVVTAQGPIDVFNPSSDPAPAWTGGSQVNPTSNFSMTPKGSQQDLQRCYDYCARWYGSNGSASDVESCRDGCRSMLGFGTFQNQVAVQDEFTDLYDQASQLYQQGSQAYGDIMNAAGNTSANAGNTGINGNNSPIPTTAIKPESDNTVLYVVGGIAAVGLLYFMLK